MSTCSDGRSRGSSSSGSRCSSRSVSVKKSKTKTEKFLDQARSLLCEMVAANTQDEQHDQCDRSTVPQRTIGAPLRPLNGRVPFFPACDLDSPRWSASKSREASVESVKNGANRGRTRISKDSILGQTSKCAVVHVGAGANSVPAVSVATLEPDDVACIEGAFNEDFCNVLGALAGAEPYSRNTSPVVRPALPRAGNFPHLFPSAGPRIIGCA